MSEEPRTTQEDQDGEGVRAFEERLRRLLAEDAYALHPAPAPYPVIRRRGVLERRRRLAVAGLALAVLAVAPVGAYAWTGGTGGRGDGPAAKPSAAAPRSPSPTAAATPAGPGRPATPGQLLDGITFEQAADGLAECLAYGREGDPTAGAEALGVPADYRLLLALRSTGDSNSPGDGRFLVAASVSHRLICKLVDGEVTALNTSGGDLSGDGPGPVFPDMNGGKLYQQSFLDRGRWKLPFRWGAVGAVKPSVAKVTVSYGGATARAALDHGWFVAAGVLDRQVTAAPHVKGYDSSGKLVYDSDHDPSYQRTLP
ncbi:hypothetical protein [Streptomyces galbus]|uniref:Tat pathway signal sequence domain protein n=1 Tax=Streptomyces galbus TaxID=33898 RepID=A0ABX1IJ24_STRGB|nr:hypothetical protein [Streptomyces galbus]NKQ25638.1 hypothetical protein [Streptomyces galbus]